MSSVSAGHLKLDRLERRSGSLLYEQIENHFAKAIRRGDISPSEALPGAMTLAKELNISHLTVRKAYELLEKQGLVSRIQGKGTIVSDAGRPVLGMITWLDDFSKQQASPISSAILLSLAEAIEADGYAHRTLLLTTPRQDIYRGTWNDHDEKMLREADLRGFYYVSTDLPRWFVERCHNQRAPLVGINGVVHDTAATARFNVPDMLRRAGTYLRECGRSRPALIFLDTVPGENRDHARKLGEELREAGGFSGRVQVIGVRQPTAYSGRAAMRRLLEAPNSVDSVVCLDDVINQGVCYACLEAKLRVPDEVLLISHANKGVSAPFLVPVARLLCDYNQAITAARRMMRDSIEGKPLDDRVQHIEPVLVPEYVIEDTQVDLYGELV